MLGLNHTKNRLREVWSGRVGDHIIALEWNRDGRLLATAESTGPVTIFDGRTGAQEVRMIGHANGTLAIGWSPTSDLLASVRRKKADFSVCHRLPSRRRING